ASNSVTRDVTVTPTNDPPVGVANYAHAVTGNVRIQVGATLLGGVTDPEGDTLTAVKDATSAEVGNVTINANGSYVYNPKPGREGADTVKYKVCDNDVPVQCSTLATITLNVSGMLWFVNSAAAVNGDGRLTSPFNTLAAFNTLNNGTGDNPAAGDNV